MSADVELDPTEIRLSLVASRESGTAWPEAWATATGHHRSSQLEKSLYSFMERNFRAAYYDTPSSLGRCRVPERDVSALLGRPHVVVPVTRDRCRSGDGCDRVATYGDKKWWCDYHGAELERIASLLGLDRTNADPRNGGNTSLFTHQAA